VVTGVGMDFKLFKNALIPRDLYSLKLHLYKTTDVIVYESVYCKNYLG
jgi:hypothetical protein